MTSEIQKLLFGFDAPGDALARPHGNCYWLLPGRLLAGEHPGDGADSDIAGTIDALLDAGVRQFIDLTCDSELLPDYDATLQQEAARRRLDVSYARFPIKDFSMPDRALTLRILASIHQALANSRVVYLHCHGGAGRTGTVAGCLLVEHGLEPNAALDLIAAKWQVMDKRNRVKDSPETQPQRDWIRGWHR